MRRVKKPLGSRERGSQPMRTSVVIAAYNEEETLGEVLQALRKHPQIHEIIVVSDGSTDGTVEVARQHDVKTVALRENRGKGYAMRVGVEHATGEILFFVDGDMLNITDRHIDSLLRPVLDGYCDMNVGVRHRGPIRNFFHLRIHFGPVLSGIRAMRREQSRRGATTGSGSGARYGLFVTFQKGMQEIVDALAARLPKNTVMLRKSTARLDLNHGEKKWIVSTQNGERIQADGVILATPAFVSAEIVSALSPGLSARLSDIPYTSAATVNLAYRRNQIPHSLDAFGFVVPAAEKLSSIACTFSSVKYPGRAPADSVLVRAFIGGAQNASTVDRSDEEIKAGVQQDLARLLGIKTPPLLHRIARYPRSLPTYRVGHLDFVRAIERAAREA